MLIAEDTNKQKHKLPLRRDPHPILRVSEETFCFRAKRGENFDIAFARSAEKSLILLSREAQRKLEYRIRAQRGENFDIAFARSAENFFEY